MKFDRIKKEMIVSTSRSGGPGGQHVNKVETKVTIRFNVHQSQVLTPSEKERIKTKLGNKLTKEGELVVSAAAKRSQLKNKEIAFKKLDHMLSKAFSKTKARIKTHPSKAAIDNRIKNKKMLSEKKKMRQKW
ncbi:MAG: alternative ribosome rescue aminoacyl-tRNA hydrolase ArfB [Bacteroidota bacterium]